MSAASDEEPVIAVAWYKPSQWERLEEIAPDIKEIWDSYEQWHMAAARRLAELKRQGRRAEKILLDVEELLQWCQANGREADITARAEFAARKLAEQEGA